MLKIAILLKKVGFKIFNSIKLRGTKLKVKKFIICLFIILMSPMIITSFIGCSEDEYNDICNTYILECADGSGQFFEYDSCLIENDTYFANVNYYDPTIVPPAWVQEEKEYYCNGDNCTSAAKWVYIRACPNITEENYDDGNWVVLQ